MKHNRALGFPTGDLFSRRKAYGFAATRIEGEQGPMAIGLGMDIREQRRAERALLESEERYRFLFEHNPNPLFLHDEASLQFLWVNEAAAYHYRYTREDKKFGSNESAQKSLQAISEAS